MLHLSLTLIMPHYLVARLGARRKLLIILQPRDNPLPILLLAGMNCLFMDELSSFMASSAVTSVPAEAERFPRKGVVQEVVTCATACITASVSPFRTTSRAAGLQA